MKAVEWRPTNIKIPFSFFYKAVIFICKAGHGVDEFRKMVILFCENHYAHMI